MNRYAISPAVYPLRPTEPYVFNKTKYSERASSTYIHTVHTCDIVVNTVCLYYEIRNTKRKAFSTKFVHHTGVAVVDFRIIHKDRPEGCVHYIYFRKPGPTISPRGHFREQCVASNLGSLGCFHCFPGIPSNKLKEDCVGSHARPQRTVAWVGAITW